MNKLVAEIIEKEFWNPKAAAAAWESGDRSVTRSVHRLIEKRLRIPEPRTHPNRPGAFKRPDKMFRRLRVWRRLSKMGL